ncbi:MAG: acyltransferase family protein, partial [Candidatus Binataceae bacterium]
FMISGLFLANVIDRPWRTYLDRKVAHFAYFYLLWMTIQFAVKAPAFAAEHGAGEVVRLYFLSLIDPFGTLWFIYMLPIFFVFIRLTRRVPMPGIWLFGAALEIAHVNTGWMVPDEFAARFVYCYTGYIFAKPIFALTARAQTHPLLGIGGLLLWGLLDGSLVYLGYEKLPFVSLWLGLVGACAVVTASALMAKSDWFKPLRYCGRNSIAIYLAFFLPMAATRTLLLKSGLIAGVGTMAAFITVAGVTGALALFWAVRGTWAHFLFERPSRFFVAQPKLAALQPAE